MRLLCCADFHNAVNMHNFTELAKEYEPDAIITLGDIAILDLRIIKHTADTLSIPAIGVCGNHDEVDSLVKAGIEDLHGKATTIDGVTFAGIGGSLRYKVSGNMFLSQKESIEIAKALPPKADVLITHDQAYRKFFVDTKSEYAKDPHEGLAGIRDYLKKSRPEYHLYGHLHMPHTEKEWHTTGVCIYGIGLVDI